MLRENLQSVGWELVEAKNRVTELENVQIRNNSALCQSASDIAQAFEKVERLALSMKDQQKELADSLAANAISDEKLVSATTE